jgi:cell division protein FtsQ
VADRFARRQRSARLRRWARVGLFLALAVLLATAAWVVLWSPLLAATRVEVAGVHRASPGLVERTAQVPMGRPLARVDLRAIERRVDQLPMVASAVVTRVWPHTVRIVVVERAPVATARSQGMWRLLDGNGVDIGGGPTRPTSLPVVALDPASADPDVLQAACAVAGELGARLSDQVREIRAVSPDDVSLVLDTGDTVVWGSSQDGSLKREVLAALMHRSAHVYDVSAPDAPTTRG